MLVVVLLEFPQLLLIPLILILGTLLLSNAVMQALWIFVLPIFVLQSTHQAGKYVYAAGVILIGIVGREAIARELRSCVPFRRAALVTLASITLLVIESPLQDAGILSLAGLQEALPYLLVALPLLTPALQLNEKRLAAVLFVATVAAAASYLRVNLSYRGVATYGATEGFSSLALIAACVAIWVARATRSRGHVFGPVLIASAAMGAAIISGTRTALTLGIIPVLLFAVLMSRPGRMLRFMSRAVPVLFLVVTAAAVSIPYLVSDPHFYQRRYAAVREALAGQSLVSSDASAQIRAIQYEIARDSISASPLIGRGPDYQYDSYSKPGTTTPFLDTPLISIAKTGYVGTAALLAAVAAWLVCLFTGSRTNSEKMQPRLAGALFIAWAAALIPIGSFLEDKGTGLGLALLVLAFHTRAPITETSQNEASNVE